MRDLDPVADLLDSAPASDTERAARWSAAVSAVEGVWPGSSLRSAPEPRTLRIASLAIDLWVFRAAFMALFDKGPQTCWGWRLDHSAAPCDAWFETVVCDGSSGTGDGEIQEAETGIELVLHARRFSEACKSYAGPGLIRFDDREFASPAAALVGALGQRMVRIAAWRSAGTPEDVDATEERLRAAFGSGPVLPPPPGRS